MRLAKTSLTWPGALQAADRRVKAGSISSVERVRAQVLADNAQLDLSQAELEQQRTYVQLSSTWDEPQPGFARVGGALDAVPASITRGALLRHLDESPCAWRPREVARGEAQVDLEKRQRIPNLTVSIGSKYDQTARDGRGERVNLIGLSMPLPLFDRNQGNISPPRAASTRPATCSARPCCACAAKRYRPTTSCAPRNRSWRWSVATCCPAHRARWTR